MHGQKRDEYKARLKDDVIAKKLAHKAQQWHTLSQTILLPRQQQQQQQLQDLEARSQLTEKLLCVNPDPLYLWNHRREQLILMTKTTTNPSEFDFSLFWEKEQNLTQTALSRNPKAYGAWFHRKWALRYYLTMMMMGDPQKIVVFEQDGKKSVALEILQMELHLCGEFLLLDERNFHCWNYRRYIVGLMMDNIAHGYNHNNDDHDDDDDDHHKEEGAVYSSFIMDGSWSVMDNGFTLQHENLPRMGAQMAIEEKEEEEISTKRGSSEKRQIYVPKNHKMANKIQQSLIAEWNFTTEKIEQNFSNGSAFHYRSKLLPLLIALEKDKLGNGEDEEGNDGEKDGCPSFVKIQVFQKELEIIRNAIFTEPDDQTSWWYFRFILSWANPVHDETNDGISMEEFQTILYNEWNAIEELVQDEDWKCKWGLLGLHMIASEFCHLSEKGLSVLLLLQEQDWKELEKTYLMRLMELDPDRRCRYQSMFK